MALFKVRLALPALLFSLLTSCITPARGPEGVGYGGPQSEQPSTTRPFSFLYFRVGEFGQRLFEDEASAVTKEVARLRSKEADRDIFGVVYIHGWQHDASPTDENVIQFKALLDSLAQRNPHSGVVGVYVAWPARSAWGPVSFWDKRSLADKIVRSLEVTRLLEHVNAAIKGPTSTRGSRLVFIGHSFGARILFSAAAQTLTSGIVRQGQAQASDSGCIGNRVCRPIEGYGDLVVLVNPALEARMYGTFSQYSPKLGLDSSMAEQPGENWDALQPPLLLAVGAENDGATIKWWPQSLNTSRDSLERVTLTNYTRYRTHRLVVAAPLSCGAKEPCACADDRAVANPVSSREDPQLTSVYNRSTESAPFGCAKLIPQARNARTNSPFIVALADRRLLFDHGGIWGGAFRQFLLEYIDAANRLPRPYAR